MMAWFSALDVKLQVALIGVASALMTIIAKDIGVNFWKETRANRKTAREIYRNYSDPLLSASVSLFWRLRETLIDSGRGAYLKTSGTASDFDKYKFESTLYRLAALIGWVRAYRRELTFLSLAGDQYLKPLTDSLSRFEAALADGAHVETQRLKSVSALWNIPIPDDRKKFSIVAVKVEQILKSARSSKNSVQTLLIDMDAEHQFEICQNIANCICDELNVNRLPREIIDETKARAARSLSIREAWLYRDFQSGIGDIMICEIEGANRRFDVLGFKDFEQLLYCEQPETKRWINRLVRVFDGIDISGADKFDARVQMLEHTFIATADLVFALADIDKDRAAFAADTLREAKRVKSDMSWRISAE